MKRGEGPRTILGHVDSASNNRKTNRKTKGKMNSKMKGKTMNNKMKGKTKGKTSTGSSGASRKRQRQTRLKQVSTDSTGLQGGGKAKGKVVVQTGDMTLITGGELCSIVRKWSSGKKEREIGGKVLYLIVGGTPCQDLSAANKTRKGVRKKRKEERKEESRKGIISMKID